MRILIFPTLSDKAPIKKPESAIASEGRVTIKEIRESDASGNAWLINGREGATAAPPIRIIIADSNRNRSVHLVGVNDGEFMPYFVTTNEI